MSARADRTSAGHLERVTFIGGGLNGMTLDLPAELADARPGRLIVTAEGRVFDRDLGRAVGDARIVDKPTARPVTTARPRPGTTV